MCVIENCALININRTDTSNGGRVCTGFSNCKTRGTNSHGVKRLTGNFFKSYFIKIPFEIILSSQISYS